MILLLEALAIVTILCLVVSKIVMAIFYEVEDPDHNFRTLFLMLLDPVVWLPLKPVKYRYKVMERDDGKWAIYTKQFRFQLFYTSLDTVMDNEQEVIHYIKGRKKDYDHLKKRKTMENKTQYIEDLINSEYL